MIKPLMAITVLAITLAGCGGSSSGDNANTNTGNNGNTGNTGNTGGNENNNNGNNGGPIGGQTGSFGDSATAAIGLDATTTVCPASVTGSFTGWARVNNTYCVWKCPGGHENADGDDWGFITGENQTCRDTSAAAGAQITAAIFAPINGCPTGGCTAGSSTDFPHVYATTTADSASLAGTYTCTPRLFNQTTQVWEDDTAIAAFSIALNADGSATADGNATTWSFANGVLTLEGSRVLNNVAVGTGSFSVWNSNTSLTRCSS